ncbi:M13 family metallopeptidase [Cellulophaga baltica]|uniref:M13 family metallopeptidase n=1 Tax=Cellulophaga TaxID=104264 RepID=UPI001C065B5B|nr:MULTISPECIES: M13 family metallopeptidase [Cellulophaga]MBU2996873.1 M13 family metallopeptidase [Cellulophaga baltica]MDO6768270.1 M13 family metallopeptidase [Cellulophaga sp. 1_MG-2023]
MKNKFIIAIVGISMFYSCKNEKTETSKEPSRGIILENMDTTVSPKNNFYKYVNGSWLKNTEIPDDRSTWGGFSVLRKSTDADVLKIIDKAEKSGKYAASTDQAKALYLFESKLDTVKRNQLGVTPILPAIKAINQTKNISELQTLIVTNPAVSAPFLGINIRANLANSKMNAVYLRDNRLGLPDRDYYLDQDEKSKEIREKYVEHITRMLKYIGENEAESKKIATKILAMETTLATPKLDKVARRDARNLNNPKTIQQAQNLIPAIDLSKMMEDMGVTKNVDTLIVTQPKYVQELNDFLNKTSFEDIKKLVEWTTFNNVTGRLTTEIETADWDFYSKYLRGDKKQRPADERALATVNGTVGEALGKLYVDEMFPPEAKEKAEIMIKNIISAFQNRIKVLDWMSDSTKVKAVEKLDKFTVKIGYPDKWEDYVSLEVTENNSYFDNILAVQKWNKAKDLEKIGELVDRTEWGMSPQTVNAYFNPLNNEIVFPAAILQPPFYDYLADDAVNYGGIGAVIGHEISHAFDDSGSRFDANGNLVNWWTEEDLAKFTERSGALSDQYDKIEVLDSVFVNGKFTLGENIGDLGGVLGAYDGLQQYFKDNDKPDPIDGFTAEQRFFMSWATVWRTLSREDALRTQVKTDPHSPGRYRATQPLQNVDAFYEAFDIQKGDSMYLAPEARVRIW